MLESFLKGSLDNGLRIVAKLTKLPLIHLDVPPRTGWSAACGVRIGVVLELDEAKTLVCQIRIPKRRGCGDVGERCSDSANRESVPLDEVEELKEPPINDAIRNVVEPSFRVALNNV